MAYMKVFEFSSGVRGYHYYKKFWNPQKEQVLECFHENQNLFDQFAIKVCEIGQENPVGHLPREISRVTKFFMDRGAIVSAQLTSEHYRRSPIVQGGIEIQCKVTVKIPGTCINLLLMEKYKQLVEQLYKEPKNEEVLGSFLEEMESLDTLPSKSAPKKNKVRKIDAGKKNDIRSFFKSPYIKEHSKESPKITMNVLILYDI